MLQISVKCYTKIVDVIINHNRSKPGNRCYVPESKQEICIACFYKNYMVHYRLCLADLSSNVVPFQEMEIERNCTEVGKYIRTPAHMVCSDRCCQPTAIATGCDVEKIARFIKEDRNIM